MEIMNFREFIVENILSPFKNLELPKHIKNLYAFSDDEVDNSKFNILIEFNGLDLSDCFQNGNSIKFPLYKKSISQLKENIELVFNKDFSLYGSFELRNSVIREVLENSIKLN